MSGGVGAPAGNEGCMDGWTDDYPADGRADGIVAEMADGIVDCIADGIVG